MKTYWISLIAFGLFSSKLLADDTEIYIGTADRVNPNVLFVFDTSGSMAYCTAQGSVLRKPDGTLVPDQQKRCVDNSRSDRASMVREAAINVLQNISGINLGIMRFDDTSSGQGGWVVSPIKNMNDSQNKNDTIEIIRGLKSNRGISSNNAVNGPTKMGVGGNGTQLVETVYEAAAYLRGDVATYGLSNNRRNSYYAYRWYASSTSGISYDSNIVLSNGVSPSSIIRNNRYISPIIDQCQKNHIVVFTDGASSSDSSSDGAIRTWYSSIPAVDRLSINSGLTTNCSTNDSGTDSCLEELAFYLNYTDNSPTLEGTQRINMHTIGGFVGGNVQAILNRAATYGGGISASADDYNALEAALTKIFDDISQSAGTFAAPAVAVNAFNSLEQLDQLYYSVFKPHESVGWSGNLKRFRITSQGEIVDSQGNPAVDNITGFFSKNAQSFWTLNSDAPDGDNVLKGGVASRLTTSRNILSNILSNNLTENSNRVRATNTDLTNTMLGQNSLSASERTNMLNWMAGFDVKGSGPTFPRRGIEDPLHSRPVLVNYGTIQDASGKNVPDSVVYIGTNSGYLHAFDTNENNPRERFAFIPKELLPVAAAYYKGTGEKRYGLDGSITVWHDDTNRDRIVNNNEKAYLYVGMRRGGSSYYALDISNRDAPKLLWQINGKYHANPTPGFDKLGQTWSPMSLVDVKWIDGRKRKVLIFGGGYDPKEDEYDVRTAHEAGNAIYMIDAATGALLWSASNSSTAHLRLNDMTSGIVGKVVTVDDNSDGMVDLLYAADLGGRIWRIDLLDGKTNAASYAQGGMIADLGTANSKINNVRFYNSLDVVYSTYASTLITNQSGALISKEGVGRYQLAIGSGYRAHPLNDDAKDNFYVIYDYNVSGAPSSYTKVSKADLATMSDLTSTTNIKRNNGFYIPLRSAGEKVLSDSVTLNDTLYFTTYRPMDAESRSGCEADTGKTRLYTIKTDKQNERTLVMTDLIQPGIPGSPTIVTTPPDSDSDGGDTLLLIGTEAISIDGNLAPLNKTHWRTLN